MFFTKLPNKSSSSLLQYVMLILLFCTLVMSIYFFQLNSSISLILFLLIYIPLSILGLLFTINWFLMALIIISALGYIAQYTELVTLVVLVFIPTILITVITKIYKNKYINELFVMVLTALSLYATSIFVMFSYYYNSNYNVDIYNYLFDTLSFINIVLSSDNATMLQNLDTTSLEVISHFVPSMLVIFWILWIFISFRVSYFILNKNSLQNIVIKQNLLPYFYSIVFILFAIITVIINNLFSLNTTIIFTLYNILFVLLFPYVYRGITFIWCALNSTLLKTLFMISFLILFLYIFYIIAIVGLLVELRIINAHKTIIKNN